MSQHEGHLTSSSSAGGARKLGSWSGLDPLRPPVALRRGIIAYAFAVLLIVWGYVAVFIRHERQAAIDAAKQQLGVIATATENHVHAMIYDGVGTAEAVALDVIARGALEQRRAHEISAELQRMLKSGEYVRAIFIVTPTFYAEGARGGPSARPDWLEPLLAETQRTTWTGSRMPHHEPDYPAVFPVAKRLRAPDGSPVWVGALFGVQALDRLYQQAPLAGGAVSLVTAEGALLLRAPRSQDQEQIAGSAKMDQRSLDTWRALQATPAGRLSLQVFIPTDNKEWLITVDRIDGYEMVAAAGQSLDAVLAPGRMHSRQSVVVAGGSTLVIVLLTVIFMVELQNRMRAQKKARDEFTEQLLITQEQERKRLANELHDSLGQNLSVIANRAQLVLLESHVPASAVRHVEIIQSVANDTIAEVRTLTRNLQPLYIDQLGLTGSLRTLLDQVASSGNLKIESRLEDVDDVFTGADATHVYRIVQEALTNVMRHSHAKHVNLAVERDLHSVRISAKDDGVGFDAATLKFRKGVGLASIDERVRLLGGRLRIESTPGAGTTLAAVLPIKEQTDSTAPNIVESA